MLIDKEPNLVSKKILKKILNKKYKHRKIKLFSYELKNIIFNNYYYILIMLFIGIILYLKYNDKKISRKENFIENKDENNNMNKKEKKSNSYIRDYYTKNFLKKPIPHTSINF